MYIHNLRDNIEKYERKENETFFGVFAIPLLILTLIISSIVWLFLPNSAEAVWFDSNWDYRVKIEVDPSKVPSTQTSFPVYVDLSDFPSEFHTNVKEDGCDIRIVESDETTETAFELVSYATSTDTGELHFMADSLSNSGTTTFYAYYGNSTASCYAVTDTYGRNAVWSDYRGVWHMKDATTSTFIDSTGGGFTANKGAANQPVEINAEIAEGQDFRGGNYYANIAHNATLSPTSNITIQAWVKPAAAFGHIVEKSNEASFRREGWLLFVNTTAGQVNFTFTAGLNSGYPQVISTNYPANVWTLVHGTYTPSTELRVYVDGVSSNVSTSSISASLAAVTREMNFGRRNNGFGPDRYYNGDMDEVRLRASTLSANWITTEYNNQSSPSTFYFVGPQETDGAPPAADSTDGGVIWFD